MATSSLRSAPKNCLLGKPLCQLSAARLLRSIDVLQLVSLYHFEEGNFPPEGSNLACGVVVAGCDQAGVPTQCMDSCVIKLCDYMRNTSP